MTCNARALKFTLLLIALVFLTSPLSAHTHKRRHHHRTRLRRTTTLLASFQEPARRIPERALPTTASLNGRVRDQFNRAVQAATATLTHLATGKTFTTQSGAEGIFRFRDLPVGPAQLAIEKDGYTSLTKTDITLTAAQPAIVDLKLDALTEPSEKSGSAGVPGPQHAPSLPETETAPYPGLRSPGTENTPENVEPERMPSYDDNFRTEPDRWDIAMPEWRRYSTQPDVPYVEKHWYDPFNRNRFKGDYPIFGQQWFLTFTGTSLTATDVRRLNLPSGVDTENPDSPKFFGRGEQAFLSQNIRLSFDLFHGDTSFRPVDFRLRIAPEINLNFLQTRERGLVNINPREGTNRFDSHIGLQEAFVEAKLKDLSVNYDFVSVRAGIQQFSSDFRGFLFSEEQPGLRLFGNLHSNRIAWNAAWFYLLEKNTNSGLNTFDPRHQQVYVANVYIQDFLAKGYTTEFSFHYNRDDPNVHFDDNGFLVRPAPVGLVVNCDEPGCPLGGIKTHGVRAYYLGWTGNGHIGRYNISHAFYQALGHDTLNPIAGRRVDINARMGAIELSLDKNWIRYRASAFYASGDTSNRSAALGLGGRGSIARGFDTIVDETHFAGSEFSFWNREGLRLTGTGLALVGPASLLPSLRSSKEEGQANFVNPGLWLFNAGADLDVTPKWRAFLNANYLRFDHTGPLEIVLFQRPIRHSIGTDLGAGFEYRPPLSENIVIRGGIATLLPGTGFEDIFTGKALLSGFASVKFQF